MRSEVLVLGFAYRPRPPDAPTQSASHCQRSHSTHHTAAGSPAGIGRGGRVQGTFAEKRLTCMTCDFYLSFSLAHRSKMLQKFGSSK